MGYGIAAALLVFTGIWHSAEWLMYGRNRDTERLIPFGIAYLVLGVLIVLGIGGWITGVIAIAVTTFGMAAAIASRKKAMMPGWVILVFIVIDAAIILALVSAFL